MRLAVGERHHHPRRLGHPAHLRKTDADTVFGLMYAQAEDDFNRASRELPQLDGPARGGRGRGAIWRDLRMKLFIDPEEMKALYARARRG
jgi:acyl-homoserine-lactone acylase